LEEILIWITPSIVELLYVINRGKEEEEEEEEELSRRPSESSATDDLFTLSLVTRSERFHGGEESSRVLPGFGGPYCLHLQGKAMIF
jgi:hypothetical protein